MIRLYNSEIQEENNYRESQSVIVGINFSEQKKSYQLLYRYSRWSVQASTLTFLLTCPFGQLTKKRTCPTLLVVQKKLNKIYINQKIIISNLCKMFWLLPHKHYLVLPLLILTDILIMTSLILNRQIKIHLEVRHKFIDIKRCHLGMTVYSSISKFGSRIAGPSEQ